MKEAEYITASNRVKVSAALTIMRDVLQGEEYGINDKSYSDIVKKLEKAEAHLFGAYSLED